MVLKKRNFCYWWFVVGRGLLLVLSGVWKNFIFWCWICWLDWLCIWWLCVFWYCLDWLICCVLVCYCGYWLLIWWVVWYCFLDVVFRFLCCLVLEFFFCWLYGIFGSVFVLFVCCCGCLVNCRVCLYFWFCCYLLCSWWYGLFWCWLVWFVCYGLVCCGCW